DGREAGRVVEPGATVRPCRLEACDPRAPYRVGVDTVTFLTFECDEGRGGLIDEPRCPAPGGTDLNGNGTSGDLVVQTLDVRLASLVGRPQPRGRVLAATVAGVCTTDARACVTNLECAAGSWFVPPGGCLKGFGSFCGPAASDQAPCGGEPDVFCSPLGPGSGTCVKRLHPTCSHDADCRDPASSDTDP